MDLLKLNQPSEFKKSNLLKFALLACTAVIVGGAVTGCRSAYRVDPVLDVSVPRSDIFEYRHWYSASHVKDIFLDKKPYHINPFTYCDQTFGTIPLYRVASSVGMSVSYTNADGTYTNVLVSTNMAQAARNRLQNTLIALAYENSSQHAAGIKSTENIVNLLMGGATIGLSSGASVAAGATSQALAAAAAGTAGARSLFNEETFRNNLAETMFQAMDSARELYRTTNILVLQKMPVSVYDVSAAIHDAEVYNEMASFYFQLAIVMKDVGKETKARNDSVQAALDAFKKQN